MKNLEIIAEWWLTQIKKRQDISEDAGALFQSTFVQMAEDFHAEHLQAPRMAVDYDPSPFLIEVAAASGLPENVFENITPRRTKILDGKPFASNWSQPPFELLQS